MARKYKYNHFAVLGLGRFGMSIVQTLAEYDVNILACDIDEAQLNYASEYATHVVQADVGDEASLNKLGLGNFDIVILATGEDFEASQIATMIAKEQGVEHVVVKARNGRQRKILESIGADEIILPEYEMGKKLARKLISSNIMDILEESEYYTITEMRPMEKWIGKTLQQSDIRRKHNLTILAVRKGKKLTIPVPPDHVITEDEVMIVLSDNTSR